MRSSSIRLVILALTLAVVFALTGCGRRTVVTVNGEKISRKEFQERLERLPIPTGQNAPPRQAGEVVMNTLVNEKLILQLAKEKKVEPTEEQINNKIEMARKEGNLNNILQQRRIGMEEFRREVVLNQAFTNIVTKGIEVTEEEVKNQYDEILNIENSPFKLPEQVEIALIHCSEKSKIDQASEMLKGGMNFETVAMRMSEDEFTSGRGGDAGAVFRDDPRGIPEEIWKTAFDLPVNTVSNPFQIPEDKGGGWYIIKSKAHKNARTRTYDEIKELLREEMAKNQAQEQNVDFNKMLEDFRQESDIRVRLRRYRDLVETGKEKVEEDEKNGADNNDN